MKNDIEINISDEEECYQFIFAYTDPFLLEFPELELYIWLHILDNTFSNDIKKVYLNIYKEPSEQLLNVGFNRSDILDATYLMPDDYDIDKVYTPNEVAKKYEYMDILNNFDGEVLYLSVYVPFGPMDKLIGEVVILLHPSTKKQVLSVCGIEELKNLISVLE